MIEYRRGDILKSNAAALVNPVNCVGVSGAGLALAFKRRFKSSQEAYELACQRKMLVPGGVFSAVSMRRGVRVYYFATKDDWRDPSRLEWVVKGLGELVPLAINQTTSIAIPALGCGHGGLKWSDVQPRIHDAAESMSAAGMRVFIYEPE